MLYAFSVTVMVASNAIVCDDILKYFAFDGISASYVVPFDIVISFAIAAENDLLSLYQQPRKRNDAPVLLIYWSLENPP